MTSNTGFGGFNTGGQNTFGGTGSAFGTGQSTGGSLGATPGFGSSAFGATSTPAFGQAATGFGGAAAAPAFGAATSTPAFGQSATGFGGASTTPAFGAATSTPAFGAASTSGFGKPATGFGGAATSTPAFGQSAAGFGGASAAPAFGAATSTPAFGGASAAPAFGAATSTPAFGTATSAPAFGSGFGGASTASAFGAKPAFGQSATGFGGASAAPAFGAASSTPAFGQGFGQPKVTAAPLGSNFGAGTAQPTAGAFPTGFGTANQSANAGPAPGSSQGTAYDVLSIQKALEKIGLAKLPEAVPSVLEQCIGIQQSLDPKSQNYLFQSYFYTLIHPSRSNHFAEPTAIPGRQDAVSENPDARCMVPVLSSGPEGLKERCKAQRAQITLHRAALNKISERLEAIAKTQSLDLKSRIDKMQLRHESLRHRIASLNRIALVLAQRGAPLCPMEEELQRQLKEIQASVMSAERFEELRKSVSTILHQQKKRFEDIAANIKADSSSSQETKAAINETIENNNRALDVLKDQLAADLQLTKFLRANAKAASGST